MKLGTYQYGHAGKVAGLRVGVARQVPRGVRREDYVSGGYFDVWMPLVAPSAALVKSYQAEEITTRQFFRRYRGEMRGTEPKHVITLLAAMAIRIPLQLGCFCEKEEACHRSVLRELVLEALEDLPPGHGKDGGCASPPCSMPDPED